VRFSILLATLGRTSEVDHCLSAIARQTYRDFEVLVVDQNPDDRLKAILEPYAVEFPLRHLRCARGHSKAFNFGLREAKGELVAFPDDDSWYDADLLERVSAAFEANPEISGITGREIVETGFTCGGRWDAKPGLLTQRNVWRRAISFTMFLRRSAVQFALFDETLGVGAGTPWGAGEETDFLLHLIQHRHRILYDPSITVWHQGRSGPYTAPMFAKARNYGMGMGRVLRKHRYSLWLVANHLIRPLGGAVEAMVTVRPKKAQYHWAVFAGRSRGWAAALDSGAVRAPLVTRREDLT
jgi:glycosyltransferase involved in cell wall biosynthesis